MSKLIVILLLISCFAASQAKPIELPDFLQNWIFKIKSFFKSPGMFKLRTISGFICNVTKTPEFRIEHMGSNLIVDIPVAILLKTINLVSCRAADTGKEVDREVIEFQLNQHRGEALKMRLLPANETADNEFPVFLAEKYVEMPPSSGSAHKHQILTILTTMLTALIVVIIK